MRRRTQRLKFSRADDRVAGTVEAIRRMIQTYKTDPRIREKAKDAFVVSRQLKQPAAFESELAKRLSTQVAFVRDPFGVEFVQTPPETLRTRMGDCDDFAALTGAALASMGRETRIKLLGRFDRPEHVLVESFVPELRRWVPVDPTLPNPLLVPSVPVVKIFPVE